MAGVLCGLETHVSGQADMIIDYATACGRDEPISTATSETTVQSLLHRRMDAERQARRPFHKAALSPEVLDGLAPLSAAAAT
jgi:hypothetical protein